jgi:hypothetical protein
MSPFLTLFFTILQYFAAFLLLVVFACAVFWLVSQQPGLKISIPVTFTLDAGSHAVTAPSLGIRDASIQGATNGINFEIGEPSSAGALRVQGSLMFPARRDAFAAANFLILTVALGVVIWVLGQLRALFRTIRDGDPFAAANALRIRNIAGVIITGELARAVVTRLEGHYVISHFTAEGLRFAAPLHVNLFALISGFIILVIAEVFRAGARLEEEQSLTV